MAHKFETASVHFAKKRRQIKKGYDYEKVCMYHLICRLVRALAVYFNFLCQYELRPVTGVVLSYTTLYHRVGRLCM